MSSWSFVQRRWNARRGGSKLVSSDSNSVVAPDVRNDVLRTPSKCLPRLLFFYYPVVVQRCGVRFEHRTRVPPPLIYPDRTIRRRWIWSQMLLHSRRSISPCFPDTDAMLARALPKSRCGSYVIKLLRLRAAMNNTIIRSKVQGENCVASISATTMAT